MPALYLKWMKWCQVIKAVPLEQLYHLAVHQWHLFLLRTLFGYWSLLSGTYWSPVVLKKSSKRRISKEFEYFIKPEYGLLLFSLSFTMLLLNFRTLDYSVKAVWTSYQYCYSHKLSLRASIQILIILILPTESKTELLSADKFKRGDVMLLHCFQLCKAVYKDTIPFLSIGHVWNIKDCHLVVINGILNKIQ